MQNESKARADERNIFNADSAGALLKTSDIRQKRHAISKILLHFIKTVSNTFMHRVDVDADVDVLVDVDC